MKRTTTYWTAAILALTLAVTAPAGSARADTEILESDVQELPVGTKLTDDQRITIPDDRKLRVLLTSTGNTKTLKGPYEGTVGDYQDNVSWWEKITGRSKESDAPIGATRGLKPN